MTVTEHNGPYDWRWKAVKTESWTNLLISEKLFTF